MSNKQYYDKNFYVLKYFKDCKNFDKYIKILRLKNLICKMEYKIYIKLLNELFYKGYKYNFRGDTFYFDGQDMIKVKKDGSLSKIKSSYFSEVWFAEFKKAEE